MKILSRLHDDILASKLLFAIFEEPFSPSEKTWPLEKFTELEISQLTSMGYITVLEGEFKLTPDGIQAAELEWNTEAGAYRS